MQNKIVIPLYLRENLSEKHLAIFYSKSRAQQTLRTSNRMLKNFNVLTAAQAELFENIFDATYHNFCSMLRIQHPSLSVTERIILAFLSIGIAEKKICSNMGITTEELRRNLFIIARKLEIPPSQLPVSVHQLLQPVCSFTLN